MGTACDGQWVIEVAKDRKKSKDTCESCSKIIEGGQLLFKWCPFSGGMMLYDSECAVRTHEVSPSTIKRKCGLSRAQVTELQQLMEGASVNSADKENQQDPVEAAKENDAKDIQVQGTGGAYDNSAGKESAVEVAEIDSTGNEKKKKKAGAKKAGKKNKSEKLEDVAATPDMSALKKATSDEPDSEIKEPVAKKLKIEAPAPVLELSASTQAVLRPIEKDTEEFWNLEEVLSGNVNGQIQDYNAIRIKKGKKPVSFILAAAQRIENPVLESRFEARKKQIVEARGAKDARERPAFHGPHPSKIQAISNTGLLPFGHALNSSKAPVDDGWFGSCRKGVYLSRYADYTLKYCNQQKPLNPGEKCRTVLFRCMPGLSKRIEKVCTGMNPTPGFDSHSSPNHSEWFLFNADQCCPSHVLTVEAIENVRTAADDM